MNALFHVFARKAAELMGSPAVFLLALTVVVVWAVSGPFYHYSENWQLIINTGTTIVTFLTVFLIQSTQNRDAKAMHLKLDELIRALKAARTSLVHLEELSDEELGRLEDEFRSLHDRMQKRIEKKLDQQAAAKS